MNLTLIWIGFIISMSFPEELDLFHYLLFSSAMFYVTYVYNQINPTVLSIRIGLLFLNIPTIVLWYIAFVYNDFLSIDPISYESFVSLFLIYIYLTLHVFFEYPYIKKNVKFQRF
jgi:hypothetical protein